MKTSFNIGLVKVENCTISKNNIYDYIFWPLWCVFTHSCGGDALILKNKNLKFDYF
jgi:hypothetical protein